MTERTCKLGLLRVECSYKGPCEGCDAFQPALDGETEVTRDSHGNTNAAQAVKLAQPAGERGSPYAILCRTPSCDNVADPESGYCPACDPQPAPEPCKHRRVGVHETEHESLMFQWMNGLDDVRCRDCNTPMVVRPAAVVAEVVGHLNAFRETVENIPEAVAGYWIPVGEDNKQAIRKWTQQQLGLIDETFAALAGEEEKDDE